MRKMRCEWLREAVHGAEKALHETREILGQHRGRRRVARCAATAKRSAPGRAALAEWLEARGLAGVAPARAGDTGRPGLGARGRGSARRASPGAAGPTRSTTVAADAAATLEQGAFTVIDASASREPAGAPGSANGTPRRCVRRCETHWPIAGLLDGVLCAASLDEGLTIALAACAGRERHHRARGVARSELAARPAGRRRGAYGVLERERALAALGREIERARARRKGRARARGPRALRGASQRRGSIRRRATQSQRRPSPLAPRCVRSLSARTAEADQAARRSAGLAAELADIVVPNRDRSASSSRRHTNTSSIRRTSWLV